MNEMSVQNMYRRYHGGMITDRWPHQKTNNLADVIARGGT